MTLVAPVAKSGLARRAIRVRGAVQGVGFRPFVWRLAHELRLDGFVRNDAHGVAIEVQGDAVALDRFLDRLSGLLKDSETQCYAWAALDNHFYLLLRTGTVPISTMNGRIRFLFWVDSERGFRRPGPRERPAAA